MVSSQYSSRGSQYTPSGGDIFGDMFNKSGITDFDFFKSLQIELDPHLRSHLSRVYLALTGTILLSIITGTLCIAYNISYPTIASICFIGLTFWITWFGIGSFTLLGCLGIAAGFMFEPICSMYHSIDPTIILSTLCLTCLVFAGFSFLALKTTRASFLMLAAPVLTFIGSMSLVMSISWLFGYSLLPQWFMQSIGLLMACFYVGFDTQLIIHRYQNGDHNHYTHSMMLFVDFIKIFMKLLKIIGDMQSKKEHRRNDNRRHQQQYAY